MPNNPTPSDKTARAGLFFGISAILCWSFASACTYLGAKELGTWSFTCLSTLLSGIVMLTFRRFHRGELRSAIFLPGRLWLITICCFAVYGLVYPWALSQSQPSQVLGVNLINYFWPTLTVICGILWVPNTRFTKYIVIALILSLAGIFCANFRDLRQFFSASQTQPSASTLPYILAAVAATTWAVYSSLLARWKSWAGDYLTSGIGFLIISLIAGLAGFRSGEFSQSMSASGLFWTILYGLGPSAGGYLTWELALQRAKVQTLGLLGAATPILSVLVLCLFLKRLPNEEILLAAGLVSGGVILSMKS